MKEIVIYADVGMPPFRSSQDIADAVASERAQIVSSNDVVLPNSSPPSLLTKAANFATSAAKHLAAGMPQCSDEERERRFAICQGCEFYDGSACSKCGCPVARERKWLSKLSWAGESCPVGKWLAEVKQPES